MAYDLQKLARTCGVSVAKIREVEKQGIFTTATDDASALVLVTRYLFATRDSAEAKARAATAKAELEETKAAAAKRKLDRSAPLIQPIPGRRKNRGGKYTPALAARLLERLCSGESLFRACQAEGLSEASVREWVKYYPEFSSRYAQARKDGYVAWGDKFVKLLEDSIVVADNSELEPQEKSVRLSAIKLVLDNLKWLLCKMLPKVYGDSSTVVHTTASEGGITLAHTGERLEAVIERVAARQAKYAQMQADENDT